jgi:hypothetical protein
MDPSDGSVHRFRFGWTKPTIAPVVLKTGTGYNEET